MPSVEAVPAEAAVMAQTIESLRETAEEELSRGMTRLVLYLVERWWCG